MKKHIKFLFGIACAVILSGACSAVRLCDNANPFFLYGDIKEIPGTKLYEAFGSSKDEVSPEVQIFRDGKFFADLQGSRDTNGEVRFFLDEKAKVEPDLWLDVNMIIPRKVCKNIAVFKFIETGRKDGYPYGLKFLRYEEVK